MAVPPPPRSYATLKKRSRVNWWFEILLQSGNFLFLKTRKAKLVLVLLVSDIYIFYPVEYVSVRLGNSSQPANGRRFSSLIVAEGHLAKRPTGNGDCLVVYIVLTCEQALCLGKKVARKGKGKLFPLPNSLLDQRPVHRLI